MFGDPTGPWIQLGDLAINMANVAYWGRVKHEGGKTSIRIVFAGGRKTLNLRSRARMESFVESFEELVRSIGDN